MKNIFEYVLATLSLLIGVAPGPWTGDFDLGWERYRYE